MTPESQTVPCPTCACDEPIPLVRLDHLPIHCNVVYSSREEARRAATGTMDLGFCPDCGLVFNAAFEAASIDYNPDYENALHHSPRFRVYAEQYVARLVQEYSLAPDDTVLEIGCGDGYFLKLLCTKAGCHGWGYDPGLPEQPDGAHVPDDLLTTHLVRGYWSAEQPPESAAMVCCRQVLEHIADPGAFIRPLRSVLAPNTKGGQPGVACFEVPDVRFTLEHGGVWDLLYEHCSYFAPSSLSHVFQREGFEVLSTASGFGGQFLQLEAQLATAAPAANSHAGSAKPSPEAQHALAELRDSAADFATRFEKTRRRWREKIQRWSARGQRVVLWGAGTKGVSFLNMLNLDLDRVGQVVDINPRKTGRYVARTGQQIVAPNELPRIRPDVVVIMNPIYRDEINQTLLDLGLQAECDCAS